jgi:hypothetical protein
MHQPEGLAILKQASEAKQLGTPSHQLLLCLCLSYQLKHKPQSIHLAKHNTFIQFNRFPNKQLHHHPHRSQIRTLQFRHPRPSHATPRDVPFTLIHSWPSDTTAIPLAGGIR